VGNDESVAFPIGNTGGSNLDYTVSGEGAGDMTVANAPNGGSVSGFRSTVYSNPATAGNAAQFCADDFTLTQLTTITRVSAEGFTVSGLPLTTASPTLTWSIFADAGGVPAGHPYASSSPATPVWTYTAGVSSSGVTTASGSISLDLVAASQSVRLEPGRYWIVTNTNGTFANRWAHFGTSLGSGGFASITIASNGYGTWVQNNTFAGLAIFVGGIADCGASWLGAATPSGGSVAPAGSESVSIQLLAAALAIGSYRAYLCVSSNDPKYPTKALPFDLTIAP
jgi:hypothetical protein